MLNLFRTLAAASLVIVLGASGAAAQTYVWTVTGTFGGPMLNGTITWDSGDVADWDLHTDVEDYTSDGTMSQVANASGSVIGSSLIYFEIIGDNFAGQLELHFALPGLDQNLSSPLAVSGQETDLSTMAVAALEAGQATTATVPEPASLALIGVGMLGLGAGLRRRLRG